MARNNSIRIPKIERQVSAYNHFLDEAEPYERISNLGIFVVKKTIGEIISETGSHYASIIRPGTYSDFTVLVRDFSQNNLDCILGNSNSSSYNMIFDLPMMRAIQKASANPDFYIANYPNDLSRYKLAGDYK